MNTNTPTQDQLKKEYLEAVDKYTDFDHIIDEEGLWHWITSVYEPKVREEERQNFLRQLKERKYLISENGMAKEFLQELINDYDSHLPTPDKDHE